MNAAPIIAAAAVSTIGLNRVAPASISAWRSGMSAPARRCRMKSTSRIELRTMMPASAMKPIIEVAVKAALKQPVTEHDADQRQRHGNENHERQQERAELRDHQKVDTEDRHPERRAHVAERDVGHLPLAVPQQSGLRIVDRLAVVLDLWRAVLAPVHFRDSVLDRKHAVDRRFESARDVAVHHPGEAAVMAEDGKGGRLAHNLDDVAKFDVGALPHRAARGQRRRQDLFRASVRSSAAPR